MRVTQHAFYLQQGTPFLTRARNRTCIAAHAKRKRSSITFHSIITIMTAKRQGSRTLRPHPLDHLSWKPWCLHTDSSSEAERAAYCTARLLTMPSDLLFSPSLFPPDTIKTAWDVTKDQLSHVQSSKKARSCKGASKSLAPHMIVPLVSAGCVHASFAPLADSHTHYQNSRNCFCSSTGLQ